MSKPPNSTKPAFNAAQYTYSGAYDHAKFLAEFKKRIATESFAGTTDADVLELLGFVEADTNITDVRSTAYLLATAFWEGRSKVKEEHLRYDKHGKPLIDKKGNPVTRIVTKWRVMQATDEIGHGSGRRYHEPVKVLLDETGILVTEHDGDQWTVNALGQIRPKSKKPKPGATDGASAAQTYLDAKGKEQSYYGRGYVQLTWWDNYVRAGVELGIGDSLLIDPEQVKQPAIAYKIMAYGMRTGKIFANKHKLEDYFNSKGTNYIGARAMVNGKDHNVDIAAIAEKIEAALMASKLAPSQSLSGNTVNIGTMP